MYMCIYIHVHVHMRICTCMYKVYTLYTSHIIYMYIHVHVYIAHVHVHGHVNWIMLVCFEWALSYSITRTALPFVYGVHLKSLSGVYSMYMYIVHCQCGDEHKF